MGVHWADDSPRPNWHTMVHGKHISPPPPPPQNETLTSVSLEAAATLEEIAISLGSTADDSRLIVGTVFATLLMFLCALILLAAIRLRSKRRPIEATPIIGTPTPRRSQPSVHHGTFNSTPTACQSTFEPQDPEWAAARAKWHHALLSTGALDGESSPRAEARMSTAVSRPCGL